MKSIYENFIRIEIFLVKICVTKKAGCRACPVLKFTASFVASHPLN